MISVRVCFSNPHPKSRELSTNAIGGNYSVDEIHIEYLTIPGATIETTKKIMTRIEEFCSTDLTEAKEHHPGKPFSFATMFYPGSATTVPSRARDNRTNS